MFQRLKVWTYMAALFGGSLLIGGCGWWPYGKGVESLPRIIVQILREDLFS